MSYRQFCVPPVRLFRFRVERMRRPAQKTARGDLRPRRLDSRRAGAQNALLAGIPDREYGIIESNLEPFEFAQQAILYEPPAPLAFAYFPNRGLISLVVGTEDGKTVEAGMAGPEGVAGVAAAVGLTLSTLRYVVHIPGDGVRIKVGTLADSLKSTPHFQTALFRYAVVQGMQIAQTAACNRLHDVRERMARWLLMAADRVNSTSLPITHDFLANAVGTLRPSVSLAAEILQRKKLIRYCRGSIEILNRQKLEQSACECYRVVRQFNGLLQLPNRHSPILG